MRKSLILLVLLLLVSLIITSCGQSTGTVQTGSDAAASDSAATQGTSSTSSSAKPKRDTINLCINTPLSSLDPHGNRTLQDLFFFSQIYEPLFHVNYKLKELIEPRLAKSHSFSSDGKVLTINLREDVKFHNGDNMKAKDVEFSIERAIKSPTLGSLLLSITDVKAVNDYTVEIILKNPNACILLTLTNVPILCEREVVEQGDKFGTIINKAGTGPYFVTYLDNDVEWKCEAFPDYYRGEAPIKYLNYKPIVEASSALVAFESGEIDWLTAPIANWDSLTNNPNYKTELVAANHISFIAINWEANEVLRNDKVRKAIAYAIDKDAMNLAAFNGYAFPADFLVSPDYNIGAPSTGITYNYDPEKAKTLLAEAGYPNGISVGKILTFTGSHYEKIALVLQANLEAVGIHAEIEFNEQVAALTRGRAQDYDINVTGTGNTGDFDQMMRLHMHSASKGSYIVKYEGDKFDYKHLDELFERSVAELDPQKRLEIDKEINDFVMETACYIPVMYKAQPYVWNKDLNVVNVPDFYEVYDWSWN